ncbi:MAG: DNA mismatch endonuclease Vsr [Akkermansia sp.]|nr:DNA mismatch endonuclease Vsr [Akkermansia sp.]
MDRHTPEQRRRNMSAVKGKDTKPELLVRKWLHAAGYRFRLHVKDLPGKPDIVLPKYKTVIFVNGCFWHQHQDCQHAKLPETNKQFWEDKLRKNVERDERNYQELKGMGWNVWLIWECEVKNIVNHPNHMRNKLTHDYKRNQ